jgi:hypothetical protein
MVKEAFPDVTYVGKEYFLNSTGSPKLDGVKRFWSWLITPADGPLDPTE